MPSITCKLLKLGDAIPHIILLSWEEAISDLIGNATSGSIHQLDTDFHTVYNKYPSQIPPLQREAAHSAMDAAYDFMLEDAGNGTGVKDKVPELIEGLSQWA